MMRKKLTTLLLLVATLNMNAKEDAMYIIGSYPFGGWDPANPIKMTKVGDIYTATVTIDCDVWFMFCSDYGDWDTVELTSFGPVDSDEQIRPNCGWNSTELNLMLYSYSMTGYGDFVFEFDKENLRFRVYESGAGGGEEPDMNVYDTNRDGVVNPEDLNFIKQVRIGYGANVNIDTINAPMQADVNDDGLVDAADQFIEWQHLIYQNDWAIDNVESYLQRYYSFLYFDVINPRPIQKGTEPHDRFKRVYNREKVGGRYEQILGVVGESHRQGIIVYSSGFYAFCNGYYSDYLQDGYYHGFRDSNESKWQARLTVYDINDDNAIDLWDACIVAKLYCYYGYDDVPLPILSAQDVSLKAGESVTILASGMEEGATYSADSSDPAVATVSVNNDMIFIKGQREGKTTISVRIKDTDETIPNTCLVTVSGGQLLSGDLTGDGVVDVDDLNLVINMMLGKAETTEAADITGDGAVDVDDLNAIINIMLGKE